MIRKGLNRFQVDIISLVLGTAYFHLTVGIGKVVPSNLSWLQFKDQRAHWIGWQFFATDQWRWPLGLIPQYGWSGNTTIVNTDSWPLSAVFFKTIGVESFKQGQYFGIALLLSYFLLFAGLLRVIKLHGVEISAAATGAIAISLTPVFWWMQRWYPAMTGGTALIVWAFYLYFKTEKNQRTLTWGWLVVLNMAVATNIYIFAMIVPICLVSFLVIRGTMTQRVGRTATASALVMLPSLLVMYTLGYFRTTFSEAATNMYGVYTANVLGLVDTNQTSRFLPDLPSTRLQYEPTSLGISSLILLIAIAGSMTIRQTRKAVFNWVRTNLLLIVCCVILFMFAVSNVISVGTYVRTVVIDARIWRLLSVFQSSVRFAWPLVILIAIAAVVVTVQHLRRGWLILLCATAVQVIDVSGTASYVAGLPNGSEPAIAYDDELWSRVPKDYTTFAFHPAVNIRTGWDECAYAAVLTNRIARCGYFSRVENLDALNAQQSLLLLEGTPDPSTVYWISKGVWSEDMQTIRDHYSTGVHGFARFDTDTVSSSEFILLFPYCGRFSDCSFLGQSRVSLDEFLGTAG